MARTTKKAAVETVAETAAPAAAEVLTYEEIVDKFKAKVAKAKAPVDARVAAQVKLFGSVDGILYILIANGDIKMQGNAGKAIILAKAVF